MINKGILMMYARLIVSVIVGFFGALTIIASAPPPAQKFIWVKPGGNDQDLKKANYVCLRESQQRVSEYSREGRSAASSSTMQTNNALYDACMNARGWTLEVEGSTAKMKKAKKSAPDQDVQATSVGPVSQKKKTVKKAKKKVKKAEHVSN